MNTSHLSWRIRFVLALIACFAGAGAVLAQEDLDDRYFRGRVVRLSLVDGDVTIQHSDMDRWLNASINTPLLRGDKIWVGRDSRAEIEFDDGSYLRLASDTVAQITELDITSSGRYTGVYISQGLASIRYRENGRSTFRVTTPMFAIDAFESAQFRVEVGNGTAALIVRRGEVRVDNRSGFVTVRRGETFEVREGDQDRYFLGRAPDRDEWDRWADDRDDYIARASSYRYIPTTVGYGVYDLDAYGSWAYVSGYGYGWVPRVAYGWRPYSYGRWVYYPAFGFSWVSYEPWGWLPYHYGRWAYVPVHGWLWVPGAYFTYWHPAPVYWFNYGTYIGWGPLAPFERFYHGGFLNINIFRFRNFHHPGYTVVNRNTFITNVVNRNTIINNITNNNIQNARIMRDPSVNTELRNALSSRSILPTQLSGAGSVVIPSDAMGLHRAGLALRENNASVIASRAGINGEPLGSARGGGDFVVNQSRGAGVAGRVNSFPANDSDPRIGRAGRAPDAAGAVRGDTSLRSGEANSSPAVRGSGHASSSAPVITNENIRDFGRRNVEPRADGTTLTPGRGAGSTEISPRPQTPSEPRDTFGARVRRDTNAQDSGFGRWGGRSGSTESITPREGRSGDISRPIESRPYSGGAPENSGRVERRDASPSRVIEPRQAPPSSASPAPRREHTPPRVEPTPHSTGSPERSLGNYSSAPPYGASPSRSYGESPRSYSRSEDSPRYGGYSRSYPSPSYSPPVNVTPRESYSPPMRSYSPPPSYSSPPSYSTPAPRISPPSYSPPSYSRPSFSTPPPVHATPAPQSGGGHQGSGRSGGGGGRVTPRH